MDKIIWCPFDLPTSNFVTVFKNNGYKVISSHIFKVKIFIIINLKNEIL
ncbi:hypothetical protein NW739_02350 [Mycoplasmopsis felis]|nr:hypothetical protein [Mycoplasmopsis felis]MCU9939621.1 hypothetical protein [Mycoplasmopsis felis]UWV85058.1 hypothetical protein NW066_06095 [Mycoplasmopsis felis]